MQFLIADTFTDSLTKLQRDEQKQVKTKSFELQLNPASPGFQMHRLEQAADDRFWSARVNRDLRLIIHRNDAVLLLCYAGHHDDAYDWASKRRISNHPTTGAAQIVELPVVLGEDDGRRDDGPPATEQSGPLIPAGVSDDDLLRFGVPSEWLPVCRTATQNQLFDIAERLPQEAAEALLELAVGRVPNFPKPDSNIGGFDHPDAQRRFRVFTNQDELAAALDYPWERWSVFLHPDQRAVVEREYRGAARVSGSAGTGKTVVALHRAAHLLRTDPDAQVLLATFSEPLAANLQTKLKYLLGEQPRLAERLSVRSLDRFAKDLYRLRIAKPQLATKAEIDEKLVELLTENESVGLQLAFVRSEWHEVVDGWQLRTWEEYRTVRRLGRKLRLSEARREQLWVIFEALRKWLKDNQDNTLNDLYTELCKNLSAAANAPYDYIIVDEAQDISVPQLRLLSALARRADALFLAGDQGQRIFQAPFSWSGLGVDIRGRSSILRVNYRTSHQIRVQADKLLPTSITDGDGNEELRGGAISVFDGPKPEVHAFENSDLEVDALSDWLSHCSETGVTNNEMAVLVRSERLLERAAAVAEQMQLSTHQLGHASAANQGSIAIGLMHDAKGLEYRAVAVMACDDDVLPLEERVADVNDVADLEEVYDTERHLLYVACTRARDLLWVSGVEPISEFCLDLGELDRTP